MTRNHETLDLTRALTDLAQLDVTQEPLHLEFAGVAVTTVDLHGIIGPAGAVAAKVSAAVVVGWLGTS